MAVKNNERVYGNGRLKFHLPQYLVPLALIWQANSKICTGDKTRFGHSYLLTNWLVYLYGRIQSPRPDVMPDRREGITRAAGFVFACIDTQTS